MGCPDLRGLAFRLRSARGPRREPLILSSERVRPPRFRAAPRARRPEARPGVPEALPAPAAGGAARLVLPHGGRPPGGPRRRGRGRPLFVARLQRARGAAHLPGGAVT